MEESNNNRSQSNDSMESFNGDASTSDMSTVSISSQGTDEKSFGTVVLSPGGYRRKKRLPRQARDMMPEDTLDGDSLHLTRDRVPVRNPGGRTRKGSKTNNTHRADEEPTTTAPPSSTAKAEYDAPLK